MQVGLDLPKVLEKLEIGVLGDVFGDRTVLEEVVGQAEDHALVAVYNLSEPLGVAESAVDQRSLDRLVRMFGHTHVFSHGKDDEAVDADLSVEFAAGKPNVELHLLDSDHGLTDVMDEMWRETARFYAGLETVTDTKA